MLNDLRAKTVYLRLVTEQDAAFICSLRTDSNLSKFISKTSNQVEAQRQWIVSYKQREARQEEYYFVICRNSDDLPIGTTRMYDFEEDPKSFRWGSWILNKDKTKYAALESALIIYKLGFEHFDFVNCRFEIMKENQRVHDFNLKMGAKPVSEDDTFIYYIFTKERYEANKPIYHDFIS